MRAIFVTLLLAVLATRADTAAPFKGVTLSPDEKSVYYHKKEGKRLSFYRATRQALRP